jgi:hypothetical protein
VLFSGGYLQLQGNRREHAAEAEDIPFGEFVEPSLDTWKRLFAAIKAFNALEP